MKEPWQKDDKNFGKDTHPGFNSYAEYWAWLIEQHKKATTFPPEDEPEPEQEDLPF